MSIIIPDVSQYQGSIDFAALHTDCDGVIIRAAHGLDVDVDFAFNRAEAHKAGFKFIGIYHRLADVDPIEAAKVIVSAVGSLLPGEVLFADIEDGTSNQLPNYDSYVYHSGYHNVRLYSGLWFSDTYLAGEYIDWLADFAMIEPTKPHTFWQFTNAHSFPGIAKACDASLFNGTVEQLLIKLGLTPMTDTCDSKLATAFYPTTNMWYGRARPLRLIVIHDEEAPDVAGMAVDIAKYFQRVGLDASAHYCVNDTIVQCVHECDTAWHAPGQNADGIGIEQGGYASWSTVQWDAELPAELDRSARLAADIAVRHSIPTRWLTDAELADGVSRGFTTHAQGTRVLNNGIGHTDPGLDFPFDAWMAKVSEYAHPAAPKPAPKPVEPFVGPNLKVDGVFGPMTQQALMKRLRSSELKWAIGWIQKSLGVPMTFEGLSDNSTVSVGPNDTIRALQRHYGTPDDGVMSAGNSTVIRALQEHLNVGKVL